MRRHPGRPPLDTKRIVVVTGAGSGIGRAIAERFGQNHSIVIAADINHNAALQTQERIRQAGGHAEAARLDVGNQDEVTALYHELESRFGRIDVQVSNAGITDRIPFLDMALAKFERVLRTNLYGTLLCGQAAARVMVRNRGGRIVNITSVSGQFGGTDRSAYGASKAAIINLTQTMAMELAPFDILVNAIAPGPTQVARTAHGPAQRQAFLRRMALQRYGTPEDVAAATAFLCSADASFITGHVLNVDGGFASSGVFYREEEAQQTES